MPTSKKKHPKLDPHFVSLQKHEIEFIHLKFRKEQIELTHEEIKAIVKTVGKSRRKVYRYIRNLKNSK